MDKKECHLDLQVWMTFFAASMHRICQEVLDMRSCTRPWHSMARKMNTTIFSTLKGKDGLQDFIIWCRNRIKISYVAPLMLFVTKSIRGAT